MRFESLARLHRSMRSINVDIQQFGVRLGAASFDCLFSTRESPYILSLTSRGDKPKFFKFEVKHGYCIADYLGDKYQDLLSVLRTDGRSGEKLTPKTFFSELDSLIPAVAQPSHVPSPEEILRLRHDLEEREKPYFDAWIYWVIRDGPGPDNLKKTLLLLGADAHKYSLEMRASSRWCTTKRNRTWKSGCQP